MVHLEFQDLLPIMARKLGGDGLINELCKGYRMLMDGDKGVITIDSLKKNSALMGLQDFSEEELKNMIREGDMDGDGALDQIEFCILMFRLSPDLKSEEEHVPDPKHSCGSRPRKATRSQESRVNVNEDKDSAKISPTTIPNNPRRGRRREAAAVEDFVRDSLEKTFASIREQNSEIIKDTENILKDRVDDNTDSNQSSDDEDDNSKDMKEKKMIVEEEDPDWPLHADGWGIRASEYFDKHPIKNVKECPQMLFLRGNKIRYREKDIRTADDLVQMIAYFYYNAKKTSCINDAALSQWS
ncbi:hypothetical protein K7X08_033382 [Anisodus acutangulus]|uniref:EF-hand domain-containing protein n=1 Tax=Anisodus acutangulus TaxID=402998 RepID=A0A9Q1RA20_9SOLA|nr:hypothetical protein K7X08_033382 [Anisodus acutangulus]